LWYVIALFERFGYLLLLSLKDPIQNAAVLCLNVSGQTIGETEDNIISFFNNSKLEQSRCILLLDNVDRIIGSFEDSNPTEATTTASESLESHITARSLYAFLVMMDSCISSRCHLGVNVTILCTAKSNLNVHLARFDDVYVLEPPNSRQREAALSELLGFGGGEWAERIPSERWNYLESTLQDLAASMVGMSYAEISQSCREAIMMAERSNIGDKVERLDRQSRILTSLKDALMSFSPASLRSGLTDGFVDMRVLSGRDLLDPTKGNPEVCPLFGHNGASSWKELESLIVVPLCQAKALSHLLVNKEDAVAHGSLCAGVLLAGRPGVGKTLLARHCASVAASRLPSIKLLEVSCTSMIHKEVGASEKAIRRLFECARSAAPCVIILDDVAIISSVRGHDNTTEGTMDRVLSTLLTELDGVESHGSAGSEEAGCIAVIGITQNVEWVDPALLRPGRLGKILTLELPDFETRRLIALKEFEKIFPEASLVVSREALIGLCRLVAERTRGATCAGVISVCNDSKRSCMKNLEAANYPSPPVMLAAIRNFVLALEDHG
jgi:SpoVK/Ycf46/Vps4 family AAA+-type ATPase